MGQNILRRAYLLLNPSSDVLVQEVLQKEKL